LSAFAGRVRRQAKEQAEAVKKTRTSPEIRHPKKVLKKACSDSVVVVDKFCSATFDSEFRLSGYSPNTKISSRCREGNSPGDDETNKRELLSYSLSNVANGPMGFVASPRRQRPFDNERGCR